MLKKEEEKLNQIKNAVVELNILALETTKDVIGCLNGNNIECLKDIKISAKKAHSKSVEIDNMIVTAFALYHPEAKDLREMLSYLKITNEFARIIDNIRTFLKKFTANYTKDIEKDQILEYTTPMVKSCYESLLAINEMIALEDDYEAIEKLYQRISIEESKTDDLYAMIEKNILNAMNMNTELSLEYFNILSALRRIERFADRTLSIASILMFAKTGKELEQL
ncbi:phosphate signaling complex PhoU family protein [Arcobacter sp. FWKO B]|uniref:phosphate signaling complex PhoU family protein n=1 Tax=Arcobacter sp. FWKO B TaxID=2593672 RepID=UPI0018A5D578|nr:PhoU domain-containing protein [Arcobacter sp. FWKO B]QOG12360.1 PhoU family transcriptional regulator [Arcobacter sp. FWKO B]